MMCGSTTGLLSLVCTQFVGICERYRMMCGSTTGLLSLVCTQFVGICWITRTVHLALIRV